MKIVIFAGVKNRCMLHGCVFVLKNPIMFKSLHVFCFDKISDNLSFDFSLSL